MRWRATVVIVLAILGLRVGPALAATHRRTVKPPVSQGLYVGVLGVSSIELRGLRVPLVIKTQAQQTILLLASMWTQVTGAHLRVVSAMDHIHARHSAHYSGLAIDFQGEQLNGLAAFFRLWGYKVYWKVPGHYQHVHVEEQPYVWREQSEDGYPINGEGLLPDTGEGE